MSGRESDAAVVPRTTKTFYIVYLRALDGNLEALKRVEERQKEEQKAFRASLYSSQT